MSFCAKCGRERSGDARFCGTCGAEFSDSTATGDGPAAPAPDTVSGGSNADATRIDRPAEPSDPFASWYHPQGTPAGGFREDADEHWQPTQTVGAASNQAPGSPAPATQATGYPPAAPAGGYAPQAGGYPPAAAPPGPPYPPFAPGPPAGPGRGSRRGLFIALAVVVVLAAGGGAYALATTLGKHSTAQPPASPSVSAPASTGPVSPGSPSVSPTPTPTPSPTLSLVSIAPGVTSSAAPAVETLLSHYFHAINSHDYAEYTGTLTPAEQAKQPQSNFDSGYSTTADSAMTLTSLSGSSDGGLTASVTFTSRQQASQSVDKSACNDWTVNFYLAQQGSGYLIEPAPAGYHAQYSDC